MTDILIGSLCMLLAVVCGVLSGLQFAEKGVPLNNGWLAVPREQRRWIDQKPLFRQSAVTFALGGVLLLVVGLECILHTGVLTLPIIVLAAAAVIYAIVSSIRMERRG